MSAVTFACPDCRTNLKTSRRIAPDRDVRCPTCGTVFPAPPETNSDLLEWDEPKADGLAEGTGNESQPGMGSRLLSTAEPAVRHDSRTGVAISPARRTRRLILGSAVIVLLFTAATAYFAWSAIVNRGNNAGTGQEDPLAYVPADSSLVVGINLGELEPAWREQFEKGIRNLNPTPGFLDDCKTSTGIEFTDLFDQVILAYKLDGLNPNEPPHTTLIARSRIPFSQNKIRDSEAEMYPEIVEGKFYYKRNVTEVMDLNNLYMPSDRILILSNLPQYDFEPLVEKDGAEPLLSTEMTTLIRGLQSDPLWAAVPFSPSTRQSLRRDSQAIAKKAPEFAQVLETMSLARAANAKGRWQEDKFSLTVNLVFADEAAAGKALGSLQSFWTQHAKGWAAQLPGLLKDNQGFIQEVVTQAKFSREGAAVQLGTRSAPPPAETFAKWIPRLAWIRALSEPRAQPNMPPGGMPPGGMPPGRMPPGRRPGGPNQRPPIKA